MKFIRYGVKVTTNGEDVRWVAIGTGYTTSVEFAHLYTTRELATSKATSEKRALKQWMEHTGNKCTFDIVEFEVGVVNGTGNTV